MNNEQIKHMVDRFLGWKLPANFYPDAGISFKAAYNEHTAYPMKHEPSGTNLFDAVQADAMIRYMVDGVPTEKHRIREAIRSSIKNGAPGLTEIMIEAIVRSAMLKIERPAGTEAATQK